MVAVSVRINPPRLVGFNRDQICIYLSKLRRNSENWASVGANVMELVEQYSWSTYLEVRWHRNYLDWFIHQWLFVSGGAQSMEEMEIFQNYKMFTNWPTEARLG